MVELPNIKDVNTWINNIQACAVCESSHSSPRNQPTSDWLNNRLLHWSQDTPDFVAECWEQNAVGCVISCHLRARNYSTWHLNQACTQQSTISLTPASKGKISGATQFWQSWKERQITWQEVKWNQVNGRWTLDWLSYCREEMGRLAICGRA